MVIYILKRSGYALLLTLLASTVIFFLVNALPGNPYDRMRKEISDRTPSGSQKFIPESHWARLDALLGLDKPVQTRYVEWVKSMFTGDLGYSWSVATGQDATGVILSRLPYTLLLMLSSTLLALFIALPVGLYSALRPYTNSDLLLTLSSFFGMAMPPFWIGLLLIGIFSSGLGWLPSSGAVSQSLPGDLIMLLGRVLSLGRSHPEMAGMESQVLKDGLLHLILPSITLSIVLTVRWSRFIRNSVLEVLNQDYVRTARAKGLPERMVLVKHVLRNGLVPVITIIALDIPRLFTGAFITEIVFSWPGMGRLYVTSLLRNDFPLLVGLLLFSTYLIILGNFAADIATALVDPRIKLALTRQSKLSGG